MRRGGSGRCARTSRSRPSWCRDAGFPESQSSVAELRHAPWCEQCVRGVRAWVAVRHERR
eukprot:10568528-Lingulodinium_polyedra.AAC.1